MGEKTESQRGTVICLRPQSKTEAELDEELGYVAGGTEALSPTLAPEAETRWTWAQTGKPLGTLPLP